MENTYSLSDIAAASKNNDYDGFGGGAWWIIILFLFMFGMGGWNNRNTNGNGEPVTEAGLCNAMNFNDLQNQVGRLSDRTSSRLRSWVTAFAILVMQCRVTSVSWVRK